MSVQNDPVLSLDKFEALLRVNTESINSFLEEVELNYNLHETKASTTCHLINMNGNGEVRFGDFANFLASKVMDFAIPRKEIQQAHDYLKSNNSTTKFIELHKKAASLFSSLKKSGEGGEVLLYLLIEEFLKVPQLLCKMNLKTSSEMHVHGCDGIHAKYDDASGLLSLYWGESKLYKDFSSGITECLNSITQFILNSKGDTAAQDRDIQLIRSYVDMNDVNLENAIVNYLDKNSPNYNKVVYKAACLVGFDYENYPKAANSGVTMSVLKGKIAAELQNMKTNIKEKIENIENLKSFELHIFLLPFPSVQEFRDAFLKQLGITR